MIINRMFPNCSKTKMFIILFTLKLSTLMGYITGKSFFSEALILQVALMGIAAGNINFIIGMFLYMSTTDTIPEVMEGDHGKFFKFLIYAGGIVLMISSHFIGGHHHEHHH